MIMTINSEFFLNLLIIFLIYYSENRSYTIYQLSVNYLLILVLLICQCKEYKV